MKMTGVQLTDIDPSLMPGEVEHLSDYDFCSDFSSPDECPTPPSTSSLTQSTGDFPSREVFSGSVGFCLTVDTISKGSWEYSSLLKKIYTKMDAVIPIHFKVKAGVNTNNMMIRALMIYDTDDDFIFPVKRCPLHTFCHQKTNSDCSNVEHILVCNNQEASYHENEESKRLSVTVPFGEPQPGSSSVIFSYALQCKSSCEGGINRRTTAVIFTLEESGQVKGRQLMKVRICSCPRRDMHLDEASMQSMLDNAENKAPGGKKRKMGQGAKKPQKTKTENSVETLQVAPLQQQPLRQQYLYLQVTSPVLYLQLLQRAAERHQTTASQTSDYYAELINAAASASYQQQ